MIDRRDFLYHMLYLKLRLFSKGQFSQIGYQNNTKLKNCSKWLNMRWNDFNVYLFIVPMKNYQKIMFQNQIYHKKVVLKLSFLWLWSNFFFLTILHFWVQHEVKIIFAANKMKIYLPVIMKCEIIFWWGHTYLCILTFTLH